MVLNIGVDLGTTNSAMAVYDDETDSVEMVENYDGETTTPSVVQILEDDVIVGGNALNQRVRYPDRTFTRTKPDVGTEEESLPDRYTIDGTTYPPERIGSYILEKLKADAGDAHDTEISGAVITVPYYFGANERKATENAAGLAELEVYRLMNEPTAACYAYGYEGDEEETLLVYDLGGGTFDATIVEVEENDITAQTSGGDKELGGENFDDRLYEHVRQELMDRGAPDPNENKHNRAELRSNVKEAKETLSTTPDFAISYNADDFYEVEISREEFQELTAELVDDTIDILDDLFENGDHGYDIGDIDNVLMVGGSTRMPHVREAVERKFEMEPSTDAHPDRIVARGAALEAAAYVPDDTPDDLIPTTDVLSHSLGVETHVDDGHNEFDPILTKDSELPDKNTKMYGNPDDQEQTLIVHVLEGENEQADHEDNDSLGQFRLEDVPADTRLDVEFYIKGDGTLEVEAEAQNRDIEGGITITDGIGLSDARMDELSEKTEEFEPRAIAPEE